MEEEGLEELAEENLAASEAEIPEEPEADKKKKMEIHVSLPVEITCREDLDDVLVKHGDWLESVLNPSKKISGGRANLRGADLSGYDLTGVNLSGATLRDAKLIGANLTGANLTAANLTHADLQGALLKGTKLKRAILTHADLREAEMEDVDLTKAHLEFIKMPKKHELEEEQEAKASEPSAESEGEDAPDFPVSEPLPEASLEG